MLLPYLADPIELALATRQAHLGAMTLDVLKYHREITPFASLADDGPDTLSQLHNLMAPGETCLYISEVAPPATSGLRLRGSFATVQMLWPEDTAIPDAEPTAIEQVTCDQAPEMLALIAIAFPGIFREQTCRMGNYLGIRGARGTALAGQLIAMAGDRFCLRAPDGPDPTEWREISGVCTHPDATGQGLATRLITAKLREHRDAGVRSFLHALAENVRAIALYDRLGFTHSRTFTLQCVARDRD